VNDLKKYNNWPNEGHPSNSKAYFLDNIQIIAPKESIAMEKKVLAIVEGEI
jgi:hypothetical protein